MARALAAAIVASLLAAAGAGGADVQTPRRGGTVIFGPFEEPRCLNPLLGQCRLPPQPYQWIREKVVPPAFLPAPNFTYQPALVSSVTFTPRRPFTLTYRIRPEARWSDGVPITARDFLFTLRMVQKYGDADLQRLHRAVRSIRRIGEKKLRIVLRTRHGGWRAFFESVLPSHALQGEDLTKVWTDRIDNPKTGTPIGSGPFLVERWDRGSHLTLVRNPRYWGPHVAHLDRIVIRFCRAACFAAPREEVLAAIRQGQVDFALSWDTDIAPELRRIARTTVRVYRANAWEHLALRLGPGGHPALRSKLVRRALAHGIDRARIVRDLFGGIDRRFEPMHSATFLTTSRHYAPNWRAYRHDPARSRRLLEQGGCTRGADEIYSCGSDRLSLRLLTLAGDMLRARVAELVSVQLRRAGIEARVIFAPARVLFGQALPRGEFDIVSFAWLQSPGSFGFKAIYGCGGAQNWTGYCQRLVTRDLDQADRILDDEQQARVINNVDRQLARDVPVVPLFQYPLLLAFRKDIRNVVPSPENPFWNAENWWLAR